MATAEFHGSDFAQLRVTFNETLNITVDYNNCTHIFDANTTLRLHIGHSAICRQMSNTSVIVTPEANASVRSGTTLLPNTVNFVPSKNVSVASVQTPPIPELVISGFTQMCACNSSSQPITNNNNSGTILFDLDKSTGLGYGNLRYVNWNLTWVGFLALPPTTQPPIIIASSFSKITASSLDDANVFMSSSTRALMMSMVTQSSGKTPSLQSLSSALQTGESIVNIPGNATHSVLDQASSFNPGTSSPEVSSTTLSEGIAQSSSPTVMDDNAPSSYTVDLTSTFFESDDSSSSSHITPSSTSTNMQMSSSVTTATPSTTRPTTTTTTTTTEAQRMPPIFNYTSYLDAYQNQAVIRLPVSIFNRSNIYQLHVRAENAFGKEASAVMNISFDFTCGAMVELHRVAHEEIVYEINVRYPPCFDEGRQHRTYQWSHESQSLSVEENLPGSTTTVNQYLIHRLNLIPGHQYTVKVRINETSSTDTSLLTETATFTYNARPLYCQITGSRISIGWNETMMLDGSASHDPDEIHDEATTLSWSCVHVQNESPCIDHNGQAISSSGSDKLQLFVGNISFPDLLVNGTFPTELNRYT